jgi:hypothetical protein
MSRMFAVALRSKVKNLLAITLLLSVFQNLHAQTLYLITGTPTNDGPEGVAVNLYSLRDGEVNFKRTLISEAEGLFGVQEDLRGNYAIMSPHGLLSKITVLKSQPSVAFSSYSVPNAMLAIDSQLLIIVNDERASLVIPNKWNTGAPQQASLIPLHGSNGAVQQLTLGSVDFSRFVFGGVPGGPEPGFSPIGRIGKGYMRMFFGGSTKQIVPVPPELQHGHDGKQIAIVAASDSYVALSMPSSTDELEGQHGNTTRPLFVLNIAHGNWHTLPLKGNVSRSRLFGDWLASIEESYKPNNESNPGRLDEDPDVARLYKYGEGAFAEIPGVLLLDNLRSGRHLEIRTGAEDSEVLNITGDQICYRVNDSIFEGEISANEVVAVKLLGRSKELHNAHWAFWEHP